MLATVYLTYAFDLRFLAGTIFGIAVVHRYGPCTPVQELRAARLALVGAHPIYNVALFQRVRSEIVKLVGLLVVVVYELLPAL